MFRLRNNINAKLAGQVDIKTRVAFEKVVIYSNGRSVEIVQPIFHGYTIELPFTVDQLYDEVRIHSKAKNIDTVVYNRAIDLSFELLRNNCEEDVSIIQALEDIYHWSVEQIDSVKNGRGKIPGISSHHLPETNRDTNQIKMQFVPTHQHKVPHSGGSQCWNIRKLIEI